MEFKINTDADREGVKAYLDKLPIDKGYTVTIVKRTIKRSLDQNALYHKWKSIIARETGNDPDTIHKVLCKMFLGVEVIEVFGERVARVKGTHLLPMAEMSEFMNRVEAFASTELGIVLPHPEDAFYEQMNQ